MIRTVSVYFPSVVGVVASGGAESPSDRQGTVADGRVRGGVAGRLVVVVVPGGRDGRRLGSDRLHGQHAPALLGQLGARLRVRVEQREVGHDDRNRKCYREDAGERAQRADEHPDVRLGRHVAVADRRHRDDRPPEADRDGGEVVGRVVLDALGVVDERREDDDAENEEEDEQRQLVSARLERVDEKTFSWPRDDDL